MSKIYTNRSNCVRAAKKALGKDAKPGTDFTLAGSGKEWQWHAKGGPPARVKSPRKAKKAAASILEQPQMIKIMKLCARANGASVEEIARTLDVEQHTVRGAVSRIRKFHRITVGREFRKVRYHCEPPPATI